MRLAMTRERMRGAALPALASTRTSRSEPVVAALKRIRTAKELTLEPKNTWGIVDPQSFPEIFSHVGAQTHEGCRPSGHPPPTWDQETAQSLYEPASHPGQATLATLAGKNVASS